MGYLRKKRLAYILLGSIACLFLGISSAFCMDLERLQKIAGDLEDVTGRTIKIVIEDSDKPDAYLHPMGGIILTKGLLDSIENDAEMAFIIGHEVGHIAMGHYNGSSPLGIAGDSCVGKEIEADGYSLKVIEAAGYNPAASIRVLGKIRSRTRGQVVPSIQRRVEALSLSLENDN